MKQTITLLCVAFLFQLNAQNLSVNVQHTEIQLDEIIDYGEILLTNNGTTPMEVAFSLDKTCLLEGDATQAQICFGDICFFPTDQATTWGETDDPILIIAPGATYTEFKFTPLGVDGLGSGWSLVFFDRNNIEDSQEVTVSLGDCSPVGTDNIVYEVGRAFPNPATTSISIPIPAINEDVELLIYNGTGVLMDKMLLNNTNEQVNVELAKYQAGIYFYHLADQNNQVSETRSFVK